MEKSPLNPVQKDESKKELTSEIVSKAILNAKQDLQLSVVALALLTYWIPLLLLVLDHMEDYSFAQTNLGSIAWWLAKYFKRRLLKKYILKLTVLSVYGTIYLVSAIKIWVSLRLATAIEQDISQEVKLRYISLWYRITALCILFLSVSIVLVLPNWYFVLMFAACVLIYMLCMVKIVQCFRNWRIMPVTDGYNCDMTPLATYAKKFLALVLVLTMAFSLSYALIWRYVEADWSTFFILNLPLYVLIKLVLFL